MYCCTWGAICSENASVCRSCGATQPPDTVSRRQAIENHSKSPEDQSEVSPQAIQRLRSTDPKSNECHGCVSRDQLLAYPFALSKGLQVKRDWVGTAASVALSAVSIPLTGFGVLRFPGKHTSVRAIRMSLILCKRCRKHKVSYELHPWWNDVIRLGYTEFLDRNDLDKLTFS
jgi:hypothetical protein